jgi:hypothetical protein
MSGFFLAPKEGAGPGARGLPALVLNPRREYVIA